MTTGAPRNPASSLIHYTALIGEEPRMRGFEGDPIPPVISTDVRIGPYSVVDAGRERPTIIMARTWLLAQNHIGHDAYIGMDCELSPLVIIGGHAEIGHGVRIGMGAIVKPYVKIGDGARIGMGAIVIHDVPAGETWAGNPARNLHPGSQQMTPSEVEGWEKLAEDAATVGREEYEAYGYLPPRPTPGTWPLKHGSPTTR